MKNIPFFVVLIGVLLSSCKSDDVAPEPTPGNTDCQLASLTIFNTVQNFEFIFEMENDRIIKRMAAEANGEFYEAEYDNQGQLLQLNYFTHNTSVGEYQLSGQTNFVHNPQGLLVQKVYKEIGAADSLITEFLYENDKLQDKISYRSNGDTTAIIRYFYDIEGQNVELKETTLQFPDFSVFFFQTYEFDDRPAHQPLDPEQYPELNANNITRARTFHTTQPDEDFWYRYTYNGQGQQEEVYITVNEEEERLIRRFFYDCP